MQRTAMNELLAWKKRKTRLPLLVLGARQVGKTWLLQEFGRNHYAQSIYINFELNEEMRQHFSRTIDPAHLIRVMETIYFKINPENTLIIFDEIQACPSAITSLKYFQENYPTYQIVAAGSLLGVAFHQEFSFPVGKVEFLELFPLSFSEFLRGIGETQLADLLQNPYDPLICDLRSRYISHLKDYYYVGGMPAVVNEFNNNHDYNLVRSVQLRLLKSYENDFAKHISSSQKLKIDLIWKSLPAQLAQENKKFIFKKLQEGSRFADYQEALSWLERCGFIYRIKRITRPALPIKAYEDDKAFKLFMFDVGLLSAQSGLEAATVVGDDKIFTEFKGALAEQFVVQQLKTLPKVDIAYWISKSGQAEIDFMIQTKGQVIPVEVKAATNLQAKSLKYFREKFNPSTSLRISLANFEKQTDLINLPLYMIEQIPTILEQS